VTDFLFESRPGFAANFALVPRGGYTPTNAEAAYLQRLAPCIATLSNLQQTGSAALDTEMQRVRDRAVGELRSRAEAFVTIQAGAARDTAAQDQAIETYRVEGRYLEWITRITTTPFTVKPEPWPGLTDVYCDLRIHTRDVVISEDRAALKIKVDSVLTVVKSVFNERIRSVSGLWYLVWLHETRVRAIKTRCHEYVLQLLGTASVGLMNQSPTQVAFATQDLERFKKEFTAREAGIVKNHYVVRLGAWCFFFALAFSILYSIAYFPSSGRIMHAFRNLFLLATGSVVGTWLSFLLRRVALTFDDLAVLEEDRLNPSIRVLFMIALTTVLGLLFWSKAVVAGIGDFQSAPALYSHGAWALLLGLLAGIAERTLGTAVSRRAADFVAAVGSPNPETVQLR
jgi:hypothetical protein